MSDGWKESKLTRFFQGHPMSVRLDLQRREVIIGGLPNPIPTQDQRTALHRELDAALDAVGENDTRPDDPPGLGRIADHEEGEP